MKLIRWAVSVDDGTGKRVVVGLNHDCPEIFHSRARARKEIEDYAPGYKPRVVRVVIEIPEEGT